MDLKALIAKMDQIESKKFLVESKDKGDMDHDGKDEKDSEEWAQNRDTAIKKATGKKDEKEVDESLLDFKGAIAQALLKEFGLQLDERPALGQTPVAVDAGGGKIVHGSTPNPAAEGEFQFSPEQEKWLGGVNRQDPYILARMPGPKPPLNYFKNPEDQAIAKRMNFGQQNLNTVKTAIGMQPGAAQTFADPAATRGLPAAAPAIDAGANNAAAKERGPNQGIDQTRDMSTAAAMGGDAGPVPSPEKGPNQGIDQTVDRTQPAAGASTQPSAAPAAPAAPTIDPNKLRKFKELLDKAEKTKTESISADNRILARIKAMAR